MVFFNIQVKLGKREWQLLKRYSQFESLDAELRAKHPQLPKLPGKTFFALKAKEDIGKRREDLNAYLSDIVNRQDLRTNSHFRDFLELDTQIPESVVNTPVKAAEIPNLNLGGRDFVLLKEEGLLFIAESDMNVASRVDSYLTNVSSFISSEIHSSHFLGRRQGLMRLRLWGHWSSIECQLTIRVPGPSKECGLRPLQHRQTAFIGAQTWRPCLWV